MRTTVTVSLPEKIKLELDRAAEADGISRSDLVRESLSDYLFVRKFRALRKTMVPKAAQNGVYTDQDVFDRMS